MLSFIGIASSVGFLLSAGMLAVGVTVPWFRYPVAACGGYAAFLVIVRTWLAWRRGDREWDLQLDGVEPVDGGSDTEASASAFGGGGEFRGGGSSASFGDGEHAVSLASETLEAKASVLEHAIGGAAEADDGIVVLMPLILIVATLVGLGATISVLYNAPALFAEVMLDGAIATAVYRRIRAHRAEHWSYGVVRRTWVPMLAITVTLIALGAMIPWLVPGADSIGDLFR